ncbi:MAG: hemolysin family protein [Gammaproteobacteria bacterium]
MDTASSIVVIILLLAANGFYVAAEFALVKARGFRIELLAAEGSAAARLTVRIQNKLEPYLAACQLGITMASLGLGWVGEPAVAAILEPLFTRMGMSESMVHTSAFLIGFLLFSALHIVIGEQVPKTFAIRKAEPVSLWVAYPLHISYLMAYPLNWLLNRATSAILSLFNVAEASHADVLSSDELKGLVATSGEHGEIHARQAKMLHNLFEFDQRQVGRIMIPSSSVHSLDVAAPAEDNLKIIRDTEHSRFPLIDSDNNDALIGIVLTKDIHRALLQGESEPWRELGHLRRDALVVPESQRIAKLFEQMRIRRAHMACVVDEYGAFIGIITLEDLIEEIVGEIHDETDVEQPGVGVTPIDDAHWEADGLVSLTDLERSIGLKVDAELDANTLSGLFMQRLARMPEVGDEINEKDYLMRVLSKDEHRVGKVHIHYQPLSLDENPAANAPAATAPVEPDASQDTPAAPDGTNTKS